jgi:hypothetical protein
MSHRPNWSRPLPRPLVIPGVMNLVTLANVRRLIERHLPEDRRNLPTWRHVRAELAKAAAGVDTADAADVSIALRMVLSMEGVRCHVR